jgi:hypothetical protein
LVILIASDLQAGLKPSIVMLFATSEYYPSRKAVGLGERIFDHTHQFGDIKPRKAGKFAND